MDAKHPCNMLLGTGHHQPAPHPAPHHGLSSHQASSSIAATMPLNYRTMVPSQHGYTSSRIIMPPPPPLPVGGQNQYTEFLALAAVDLAKRGVRLEGSLGSLEMTSGYKRKRDEQSAPVLGAAHVQQQQTIIVDRFLLNHASKMWEALAKQRQRYMRLITSTIEDRTEKRLKAKNEEMKSIWGANWALQEQLKNLHMEAQMWHELARSSEVETKVLRSDLQHALKVQMVRGRGVGDVDDASSYKMWKPEAVTNVRRCKGCGLGEAVVLLLPCRHLCVCASCATLARECPVCGCTKTDNICVNFS